MRVGFTMDFRNTLGEPWRPFWEDRLWLLQQAEAMGFDYVVVQEHLATDDGYAPSIPVFLTLLVERTRRIRVGSYTYVLPLHNAVRLAQETAVLDHLSEGRLDVCVGSGHRAFEYALHGYNPKTRPSRMEEGLEVLKQAWTGRPFTHHGRYYDLTDVTVAPAPLQSPHPPLWVAASAPPAAERAGRHGAHLHGAAMDQPFWDAYFRGLAQSGVDRADARISVPFAITVTDEDPEAVWARHADHYFERWDFYSRIRSEMGDPDLDFGVAAGPDTYRSFELIGDPDTVIATLRGALEGTPVTDIVHSGPAGGISIRDEAYPSLQRFAEDVLPVVQGW
jgi:alkanesulfonate monooxygenase SsuD/methylene tetrahydromethanopterin reductase-like flavin-dependent oxidoreductase (luciferase family)